MKATHMDRSLALDYRLLRLVSYANITKLSLLLMYHEEEGILV